MTHDLCQPPAVRFNLRRGARTESARSAPAALAKKHAVHPREADSLRTAATLLQIWGLNASLRRSAIVFREKKQKKLDWSKIGAAAPPRRQALLQGANANALQEDLDVNWGG